jgi:NDP-sugar pyrophosphorylase family protein
MKPNELYNAPMENDLSGWLTKFDSLASLFVARHQLHANLSDQRLNGSIEDGATIVGPVHIGANSTIHAGAIIKGPVVIGPNVEIGYGSTVLEGSFIGTDSKVRPGAIISDSMVMNRSTISENAVIRNSILGCGVFVHAGVLVGDDGVDGAFVGDDAVLGLGSVVLSGTIVPRQAHVRAGLVASGLFRT